MLTYIVNTLFKNKKLKQSLLWADKLKDSMDEFHQLLYDKYFFFYYNALVFNYSVLDPLKAIEILEDLKDNTRITSNSFYHLFVYLNLAVLRFDQKEFKESIKNFTKITILDGYKNAVRSLRLKISICELITRYELQQNDVLDYKLAQVRKDYKDLLELDDHYSERELILIIKAIQGAINVKSDKKMVERISQYIEWTRNNKDADAVIIDYGNWLEKSVLKVR
jgi:tetratricopeptide (TPR) repeat protein